MKWGRFLLALVVTSVVTLVVDVVLNAIVFRKVYKRSSAFLLPSDQLNTRVFLGWAALLVIVSGFGYLLVRGGWRGVSGGLQFGSLLALTSIAGVAGIASIVPWPAELLVAIGVQQLLNSLLLGLVFGLFHPGAAR
jgi:hypothetical protein